MLIGFPINYLCVFLSRCSCCKYSEVLLKIHSPINCTDCKDNTEHSIERIQRVKFISGFFTKNYLKSESCQIAIA